MQIAGTVAVLAFAGLVYMLNEIAPGSMGAPRFYERGVRYLKDHDNLEAIKAFNRAIELDSTFDKAYFARAVAHWRLDDSNAALADYASFIRLKPDDAAAYQNRSLIYAALGDPERALADLDVAARLKPDNPDVYLRRAEIYRGLGDFPRALAARDALARARAVARRDLRAPPRQVDARSRARRCRAGDRSGAARQTNMRRRFLSRRIPVGERRGRRGAQAVAGGRRKLPGIGARGDVRARRAHATRIAAVRREPAATAGAVLRQRRREVDRSLHLYRQSTHGPARNRRTPARFP